MGGVDLFDQFVSRYRVRIRSKRWWWPFFAWSVNASMANAWNLFRTAQKQKVGMLEFQREVVMTILASFGRNKPAKSLAFSRNAASNVKLDTKNHIPVKGTSKYCRCKHRGGRSIYLCQKCNVPCTLTVILTDRTIIHETLIVLFPPRSANNVNPATIFSKI